MSTLKEQLDRLIKRKGEQDPVVQVLRNQIAAEQKGKSLKEMYLEKSAEQEDSPDKSP